MSYAPHLVDVGDNEGLTVGSGNDGLALGLALGDVIGNFVGSGVGLQHAWYVSPSPYGQIGVL